MSRVVLVAGTWGLEHDHSQWWRPASPFAAALRTHGHELLAGRAFVWTTDLEGVLFWRRRRTWSVAGENLYWFIRANLLVRALKREPDLPVVAIGHSHGGQVLAYAAWFGARFDTVVTIATPVRADMDAAYARLRARTRHWVHLHSDWSDRMQIFGELFDGTLGVHRAMAHAHVNRALPNAGHSGALEPGVWDREGLWSLLP